jgi:excisionase family DNA binding protein
LTLLTLTQFATLCQIDRENARDLLKQGKIKFLQFGPHSLRIRQSEVARYLNSLEVAVGCTK